MRLLSCCPVHRVGIAFFLQCFKWWNWVIVTWFGWRLVIVLECKWKMRNKDLAEVCGFWEILHLVFQKQLATMDVRTENLAVDLVFLQRFSGSIVACRGSDHIVSENLWEQFLESGWAVGKILMDHLMFSPLDAVCLFISPVILALLLDASLMWCAELKGVLAKTREELPFPLFEIRLYICPPENVPRPH